MSNEATTSLRDRVNNHEMRITALEELMVGSIEENKPGLIAHNKQMTEDIYDAKTGLKSRMDQSERREIKRQGWISGAYFAGSAIGGIVTALIIKFFKL